MAPAEHTFGLAIYLYMASSLKERDFDGPLHDLRGRPEGDLPLMLQQGTSMGCISKS